MIRELIISNTCWISTLHYFFIIIYVYFYTPVIIKINPVGYTPLPSIVHTLTGLLDVPAQWFFLSFLLPNFVYMSLSYNLVLLFPLIPPQISLHKHASSLILQSSNLLLSFITMSLSPSPASTIHPDALDLPPEPLNPPLPGLADEQGTLMEL